MWADLTYPDCDVICDALEFNRLSHVRALGIAYKDGRTQEPKDPKRRMSKTSN